MSKLGKSRFIFIYVQNFQQQKILKLKDVIDTFLSFLWQENYKIVS